MNSFLDSILVVAMVLGALLYPSSVYVEYTLSNITQYKPLLSGQYSVVQVLRCVLL